ncbi:MAG: hypothetical protein AAB443_00950 [Patescibacteria group bacterium]
MKRLLFTSSFLAIIAGFILVSGATWAIYFTYTNIALENITTPEDASIPNTPVRGPLTLKAQADIIRIHALRIAGGKTYAEMPRQIPKLDEKGNSVLDDKGNPVMTANTTRDIWVTATTLRTALHLAILTYAFSGFTLLFGLISIWTGVIFLALSKRKLK